MSTARRVWSVDDVEVARSFWRKTGTENMRSFVETSRRELKLQIDALKPAIRECRSLAARFERLAKPVRALIASQGRSLQYGRVVLERLDETIAFIRRQQDLLSQHRAVCDARRADLEETLGPKLSRRGRGARSRQSIFVRELLAARPDFGTRVDDWLALDDQIHFLQDQRVNQRAARRRAMTKLLKRAQNR